MPNNWWRKLANIQGRDIIRISPMSISLCMIVKDEAENLPRCLESVQDLVHECIVVDTGSTDATCDIATRYGARVHSFTWNNDFAAARNVSLDYATGDWVLVLDADEVLTPEALLL
jgi:glycosyltransferase involved in cell wall biosynthesis